MENLPVESDVRRAFLKGVYGRWIGLLSRHRMALTVVLVVTGLLFSWASAGIRWNADLLTFFSADSADVVSMRQAAEQAGVAAQLRIDLHVAGQSGTEALRAAVGEVAQGLRATGQFRSVWAGVDPAALASAYGRLVANAPLMLSEEELARVDAAATPEALGRRFSTVRARLADPDGELLARQLQADPLDLGSVFSGRLRGLAPEEGATTSFDGGLLIANAADGPHAMIVADPLALPSDHQASEAMLQATAGAIAAAQRAHPGLEARVVGAHRGYVENANRVRADVAWISFLGTLAVAAAIALFFRRLGAALLCMIPPAVGVGLTLGVAGLLHVQLPLILLGFAGLLCGSTTDYGIQLIAESRRLAAGWGGWHGAIPGRAAAGLRGAITMSAATSVTAFAALGLSDAPGLRALGLFVAAGTAAIWMVTFLLLPAYVGPWVLAKKSPVRGEAGGTVAGRGIFGSRGVWVSGTLLFLATCALLLVPAARVRFNADPHGLDGSSQSLLTDEADFYKTWGDIRNRAIVLVSAEQPAAALAAQARVQAYLQDLLRDGRIAGITSAASLLPDEPTSAARLAAWQAHWTAARRATLRENLAAAAGAAGFAPGAFSKYADRVAEITPPDGAEELRDSPAALFPGFISTTPRGTTLATIVAMNEGVSRRMATAWAAELRLRFAQLPQGSPTILSGNVLLFDATDRARAEGERFAPWCLLAILLPLCIYFRSIRRAWLALVCLLVGFVWVLAAAQLFAGGLNLLSLVPVLFTLGVAVDYGIYAASDPGLKARDADGKNRGSRLSATGLCAVTTILGSGSLMLASHPALRWLGITLVAGISGGYLASLLIVAPLTRYAARPSSRRLVPRVAWAALSCGVGLLTVAFCIPPLVEWKLHRERPAVIADPGNEPLVQNAARTFSVGPSLIRYQPTSEAAGIWEIALVGDAAHRGRAVSLLAANLDDRIESEMLDQLDSLLPQEWSRWLLLRAVGTDMALLPRYIPAEDQQEIYAAAMAYTDPHGYLAPTYPRILSYHALHDVSQMLIDNPLIVPNSFACTGVVSLPSYSAAAGGHLMLARNFDFEGGESFGRQKSVTYIVPPPGEGIPFAHVAWPGLAGCVTGINQERIAVFINAAATGDHRLIGTPTILVAREILQHAHSLADAQRIIEGATVFVSDILVVADGKTGQARVFEKSPARTAFYDVSESAALANELTTPVFADDLVNRSRIADSTTHQRLTRARELLNGLHQRVTPEGLAGLLRDKSGLGGKPLGWGNRNAIDGLIACHSVIIDVTSGQMWVAGWPNAEGAFVGTDVLATLEELARNRERADTNFVASASPPVIGPDNILVDGTWPRILAAREAADRAVAALKRRDPSVALEESQRVIANNPAFYLGHELKGRALFARGDKAAAKLELQKALAADPPYTSRRDDIEELINQCDVH